MAAKGKQIYLLALVVFLAGFLSGAAFVVWRGIPQAALSASRQTPGELQAPDPAQVAEVLSILENEVKAAPQDPQPLLTLGSFLIDLGRFPEAAGYFQRALELSGPQSGALTDLGYCLREMNRPEEALAMFDQAISLDSKQKSAYYNAGIVALHDLNDKQRALSYFEAYLKLDPPPDSLIMIERLVTQLKSETAPLP